MGAPPKVRFATDSPLEERVMSEPVSEGGFPGYWEKYRVFQSSDARTPSKREEYHRVTCRIP
jgi:hypothetical protein